MARRRLVFEELFLLAIGLKKLRNRREDLTCAPYGDTDLSAFYSRLPFALTGAQRRTIGEILGDLRSRTAHEPAGAGGRGLPARPWWPRRPWCAP